MTNRIERAKEKLNDLRQARDELADLGRYYQFSDEYASLTYEIECLEDWIEQKEEDCRSDVEFVF